jgi:DNA uptake protein ComE-like DNA-binding protein
MITTRCQHAVALAAVLLTAGPASLAGQVGRNQHVLNPNLATEEQLAAVPGLDGAAVRAIVGGRPFPSMTALHDAIKGARTPEQMKDVYARVFLPINLNTASRDEIMLVPGMGPRMAHEFEEYRPYRALTQFRREIGKYVDSAEVARLEQFVFVPLDLNSASDDDLMSIPGMGPRMLREFKEYRPYRSIEQFRREIGKYVNENEVARFERYVTIR